MKTYIDLHFSIFEKVSIDLGVLFQRSLLERYVEGFSDVHPDETPILDIVQKWIDFFRGRTDLGESNLEQAFNEDFFINILGYVGPPSEQFNFLPKQTASEGQIIPDFLMGTFVLKEGKLIKDIRRVVGELKGPKISLDRIDPSRKKTPVEQAFEYARNNGIYVDWVIVSNLVTIRLYRNSSMWDYEEFNVINFISDGNLTKDFWTFYYLLHNNYFLEKAPKTAVYNLLLENFETKVKLTDSFYKHYREILLDTYREIENQHPNLAETKDGQMLVAQSSQKLLHRGLLACFMSDHPQRLLSKGILNDIINNAQSYPSLRNDKIYSAIKDFFKCIDKGSPKLYPYKIFGYDGSLFSFDKIIDTIELPDSLFEKEYSLNGKQLDGIFGFRTIDFYYEFSPHLLGRLFEYSINDQEEMFKSISLEGKGVLESFNLQRELGVVYTREVLTNFAAHCILVDTFTDIRDNLLDSMFSHKSFSELNNEEEGQFWKAYMEKLLNLKILDLAVGSGAFLVACYNILKQEISNAFEMQKLRFTGLQKYLDVWESSLLEDCLYGKDVMSDAISIAKLALWIASIHKDIPLKDFKKNFIVDDSLDKPISFDADIDSAEGYQKFDIVIGNPPWGAEINESALHYMETEFNEIEDIDKLDSYELFIHTALRFLKKGGRLCYILPHTLLYPEKKETRKYLVDNFKIERWHYLGSDWFGKDIRMNTTLLQLKKEKAPPDSTFESMTLVGEDRKNAIKGRTDLIQLEKSYSYPIPQERSKRNPSAPVELFRYIEDDPILSKMESKSIELSVLCDRGRGVEINKAGIVVQCPSCGRWVPPPSPIKNKPQEEWKKKCNHCNHEFLWKEALSTQQIVSSDEKKYDVLFIDGDSFSGRYGSLEYKSLKLDYDGINYKDSSLYEKPKIFIRQAGVGLSVAFDENSVYCPQSVYVYRIKEDYPDVNHKLLLAVLQSRVFAYYVFKKFGEIDASQAFSKLTHVRLGKLPIPASDHNNKEWQKKQDELVKLVDEMLIGGEIGSTEDWKIERFVQELYELEHSEVAHIMGQLGLVGYHKAMKEMFPKGPPPKPKVLQEIKMK
jgi:type I restriction-modification system DNA methylase subunit